MKHACPYIGSQFRRLTFSSREDHFAQCAACILSRQGLDGLDQEFLRRWPLERRGIESDHQFQGFESLLY